MTNVPRASFSIRLLTDEDYYALTLRPGGLEALGAFLVLTLAGRERLTQDKAVQVEGTDALRFAGSIGHVLSIARLTQEQFDNCMAALAWVAAQNGGEPWIYVDEGGRIVIRSFFKFNTDAGWGGSRTNAGRKPRAARRKNQEQAKLNQDEIKLNSKSNQGDSSRDNLNSSCLASGSGSGSGSGLNSPLAPPEGKTSERATPTVPDEEPLIPPANPDPTGGAAPAARALGPNSAAEVRRVLDLAEREFPLTGLVSLVEQHLHDHPARRIVDAIVQAKARRAGNPGRYIATILAGPDPTPAARPAAAPRPEPAREVYRASDERRAEDIRRLREREASLTAPTTPGRPTP